MKGSSNIQSIFYDPSTHIHTLLFSLNFCYQETNDYNCTLNKTVLEIKLTSLE